MYLSLAVQSTPLIVIKVCCIVLTTSCDNPTLSPSHLFFSNVYDNKSCSWSRHHSDFVDDNRRGGANNTDTNLLHVFTAQVKQRTDCIMMRTSVKTMSLLKKRSKHFIRYADLIKLYRIKSTGTIIINYRLLWPIYLASDSVHVTCDGDVTPSAETMARAWSKLEHQYYQSAINNYTL